MENLFEILDLKILVLVEGIGFNYWFVWLIEI